MKLRFFVLVLLMSSAPAFASLKDGTKVFSSGAWTVIRDIDKMTDKVDCTGVQNKDYGIQLTPNKLFITVKGGISGVKMRFDDAPVLPFRFGEEREKRIDSIIIEGSDLSLALASRRLRMQVSTLVSGVAEFDIDLNGIDAVMQNIKEGCPTPAINSVLASPVSSPIETYSFCDKALIARMQKSGVTKTQIAQICSTK